MIKNVNQLTKNIIDNLAARHEIVTVEGLTKVERYLNMIHLGDWVSFWCAILHKTDPTPVTKIDKPFLAADWDSWFSAKGMDAKDKNISSQIYNWLSERPEFKDAQKA